MLPVCRAMTTGEQGCQQIMDDIGTGGLGRKLGPNDTWRNVLSTSAVIEADIHKPFPAA